MSRLRDTRGAGPGADWPTRFALTPSGSWGTVGACCRHSDLSGENTVDPYRLPTHVVPSRYDLRLEPDLATLSFHGEEPVTVTVAEATDEVVLNAVELAITEATIANDRGESLRGVPTMDEAAERCRIAFPRHLAPGAWRLRLVFTGHLNDKLRGFYRSSYKDASGATPPSATRSPSPHSASSRSITACRTRVTSSTSSRSPTSRRARWRTSARSRSGRPRSWWTSARRPTPRSSASLTSSRTRTRTCGSATSSR